jgi:lysyl-tRNA synthetase class 2
MGLWEIAGTSSREDGDEPWYKAGLCYDYPRELSPLSDRNEDNPDFVERFEIFIAGREMSNASASSRSL